SKGTGDEVDSLVAKNQTGNQIDNEVYFKLSQDLNSKLNAALQLGYESTIDTGETITDVDNQQAGAYVKAIVKYVF
ncbi:MAG: hypothetical protein DSY38_03970, partial [Fusobacteria bacterium]